MPFESAAQAIQSVAEFTPEFPFWPQLPRRSDREAVIGQGLGMLADLTERRAEGYGYQVKPGRLNAVMDLLHRSTGELSAANATGFYAFEEALASGLFGSAQAVKGQIEGPITLAAYLFHQGRPFLADPALFAAIAFHVSQMVCWQIDRLKASGSPVILSIDEPALCLEAAVPEERRLSALAAAIEDARRRGALVGLHCCAARPFGRMCRVTPDILSFDAHEGLELFFEDADALRFARDGGIVAYGLIPTWPRLDGLDASAVFGRWLAAASLAGDPREFARRAMVTATCGLGLLEADSVGESFGLARKVGGLIGTLAGD